MRATAPAAHLVARYFVFTLTLVCLLTMTRAAYALWQYPKLEQTQAYVPLFVQGLRFDLALAGLVCLLPVVIGSLLASNNLTLGIARFAIVVFLIGGLALTLTLELITPWFIQNQAVRPDVPLIQTIEQPLVVVRQIFAEHTIASAMAVLLCIMVLFGFWVRLDLSRLLRSRLSVPSALMLATFGGAVCLIAIWSTPDLRQPALSPGDALISRDVTINDMAMNSSYKTLYSLVLPVFNQVARDAQLVISE